MTEAEKIEYATTTRLSLRAIDALDREFTVYGAEDKLKHLLDAWKARGFSLYHLDAAIHILRENARLGQYGRFQVMAAEARNRNALQYMREGLKRMLSARRYS